MSFSPEATYTARWIVPVEGTPLPQGTITIQAERIVAVEPHGTRHADADLGNTALLPGFVNAHTHLDLTGLRGLCPPTPDFTHWLRCVIRQRHARTAAQVQADIAAGVAECLRHGTTLLGDIASAGASWEVLSRSPCRSVIFYELLGLTEERARQGQQEAQQWFERHPSSAHTAIGTSPHAPYSVRHSLYEFVAGRSYPVATHLAETEAELELLRSHSGPLVEFLKELAVWDPSGLIADPRDLLALLPTGVFVHGNYLDCETRMAPGQSLVFCPRTHHAFGHPAHPFASLLQRGVRVALGTDSLASNPDLDILAEARFLRQHSPGVEPALLLRMLTLSGAEALGLAHVTGSLRAGKSADLAVVPLPDLDRADPHDLILETALAVRDVMVRGQWIAGPIAAAPG